MGRTACTEPQCLYKGALQIIELFFVYWVIILRLLLSLRVYCFTACVLLSYIL